jgi:hypothetical protein
MKMHEILPKLNIITTSEESAFLEKHGNRISIDSLNERDTVLAHNLARKGIYKYAKDRSELKLNPNAIVKSKSV